MFITEPAVPSLGLKLYPSNMQRMLNKELTRFMQSLSRIRQKRASERKVLLAGWPSAQYLFSKYEFMHSLITGSSACDTWIGHFRVDPSLCFKARLSAKASTQKWFFLLVHSRPQCLRVWECALDLSPLHAQKSSGSRLLLVQIKTHFKRKVLHFAFFWKREFLELGDGLVLEHSEYRYTKLNKGFIKKMITTKEGCHEISNFPRSCYMLRDNSKSTLQLQFHLWLLEYIQWQWLQTKQNMDNLCLSRITFLILELTYKAR